MKLKLTLGAAIVCTFLGAIFSIAQETKINSKPVIVPAVAQWEGAVGSLELTGRIYYNTIPSEMKPALEMGIALLESQGLKLSTVWSNFSSPKKVEDFKIGTLVFSYDPTMKKEAYEIDIDHIVQIKSGSSEGLIWGVRTLQQMLKQSQKLPRGKIVDSPKYPIRSLMLDVGRKYYPIETLYQWIDICSYLKINEIHLHLNEHIWGGSGSYRLESKIFPALSTPNEFYTFKQMRELIAYAKVLGIDIVPEIDTPGHSNAFTKMRPDLAHREIGDEYLDILNPESIELVKAVIDEVAPLFPSSYFHIGTDEYRLGYIANKEEREKTGEAFRQYINELARYVKIKHGKKVRIWSGYENMPGTTQADKDITIDMWETSDANEKSKSGYSFINSSHGRTYIVPGAPYYGVSNPYLYEKWTPRVFDKEVLPDDAPGVLGGKLHVWSDMGPTGYTHNEIARLVVPSLAAMSNGLWGTRQFETYGDFVKKTDSLYENIPNVYLNQRVSMPTIVWELKNKHYFVAESTYPMTVKIADRVIEDLEWPWTATFVVNRTRAQTKNQVEQTKDVPEVLISSPLAGFYLDLERITDAKNQTVKRGIGVMRSQRNTAADPTQAWDSDKHIFNYKMPINEEVVLTFVGTQRNTKLYVNGKFVDQTGVQMLCPLKTLGNNNLTVPSTFQGYVKYAQILNKALNAQEVAEQAAKLEEK